MEVMRGGRTKRQIATGFGAAQRCGHRKFDDLRAASPGMEGPLGFERDDSSGALRDFPVEGAWRLSR